MAARGCGKLGNRMGQGAKIPLQSSPRIRKNNDDDDCFIRAAAREWQWGDFACMCSRIDRAVTDKESMAWLQKPVRDLPTECVAYICTKAEDIARTCADAGADEDNGRRGVRNNYDAG